jgi:hypothetical protein
MTYKATKHPVIAAKRFLEGTAYKSPDEAVRAGHRTIEEWCDAIAQAKGKAEITETDRLVRPLQEESG